ncbi:Bystin-domain-containing protein [Durotheca rogersii]|uniref:Bystin-domain-containing protein n=1 Tax=Durotheca rogersii TaxID=419775 RepID=UPI0022200909|nr:Bystin-domain-containing protein [Durotheca rogersii]KAI5866631.1 Bystin-domain-containing protein [Durotheca rogersii]
MPKATAPTSARQPRRHNPLEDDLLATGPLRTKSAKRKSKDVDEDQESYVDSKASKKILRIGRELAEEVDTAPPRPPTESTTFDFNPRSDDDTGDDDAFEDEETWGDDDEVVEEVEIEPGDLDLFNKFLPTDDDPLLSHGWDGRASPEEQGGGTNLADLILAKIAEHETGRDGGQDTQAADNDYELSPKVVEAYTKIGLILSRYKSGKLPKPFKILPTVPHWEDIIQLTQPDKWTPNACYEATKLFVSSKPVVVRRFIEMILLDRVREDIYETKKLNVHLFNALKKALFKPAAWFKGFLFPLVESGTCTLREATIISAVLARVSVPVLHSGAAIKGLCDIAAREASAGTEGGGATNIFIRTLLEKKYALPYQVIDSVVFHFLRFRSVDPASVKEGDWANAAVGVGSGERAAIQAKLPVIWHQCMLAFAQRYRNEITEDQREALLDLLLTHGHHKIGPEIRRELLAGRGRGVPVEQPGSAFDGDDTMIIDS